MKLGTIEEEEKTCRKAWAKPKAKYAWHCHHEKLVEELTEPAENRITYIVREKPVRERALRLRLFRPASEAVASARKAYDEAVAAAEKAYDEAVAAAEKAYDEAVAAARKAYDEAVAAARKAYDEAVAPARKAYDEVVAPARKAYNEAVALARKAYDEAVAAAHSKECPGCPWDSKERTIFP